MKLNELKEIGLTDGEIRVYQALLSLGESTKTELAKHSKVSQSKIYEVAAKLADKGIISIVKKDGLMHFKAATPQRLLDFLDHKEQKVKQEKELITKVLPSLLQQYKESEEEPEVEVFFGWQGMKTVYGDIARTLGKGDVNFTFGASLGKNSKQADIHYNWYYRQVQKKGFKTKIIFNEEVKDRKRAKYYHESKLHEVKYLYQNTNAEINFYKNKVLFILLLTKPLIIRITSQAAADAHKKFFTTMWKRARN